jgi:hypothetical protein
MTKKIKLLPAQQLQQRITKVKLEDMSKEELVEYADYVLGQYFLMFNQVRVNFLINQMNTSPDSDMVTMFYEKESNEPS